MLKVSRKALAKDKLKATASILPIKFSLLPFLNVPGKVFNVCLCTKSSIMTSLVTLDLPVPVLCVV
jgi:hypothetical protein